MAAAGGGRQSLCARRAISLLQPPTTTMPKTIRFHEFGSADVLRVEEGPAPEPQAGEVLLQVAAIGLNRAEVLYREGKYLDRPRGFPAGLGYEAAGTIAKVGPGVTDFQVGERVSTLPTFSLRDYSVYAEQAVVPTFSLTRYPENLGPQGSAAVWLSFLTAYGLVEFGGMRAGDLVVITAASSSVGNAAIQLARSVGAVPIATTRGSDKRPSLLAAGAAHVVATAEEDLGARLREITGGKGARLVFDAVAGPGLGALVGALAPGGTAFVYGALDPAPTVLAAGPVVGGALTVRGFHVFEITGDRARRARALKALTEGFTKETLRPLIDRTFPLDQIADAHRYMESNRQNGKIVVTV